LEVSTSSGIRRLIGTIYTEPSGLLPALLLEEMGRVERRFALALRRALRDKPDQHLDAGVVFITGMLVQAVHCTPSFADSGEGSNPITIEEMAELMVAFACAGLRALPATEPCRFAHQK
jgi:hypothetical protein